MHGSQAQVVAVDERVGQRFAQRTLRVVGHADTQQARHQLLLAVAGTDPSLDLFHHTQQRPAKKVVDCDVQAVQDLKCDLVGGDAAAQRVFLAKQQQCGQTQAAHLAVGIRDAEGLGEIEVGQIEQRLVASAAALAHAAAKPFEFQRIEILPASRGDDLCRRVVQPAVGLH